MRDTTERPEAIEAGTAKLIGTKVDTLVAAVQELLDDPAEYNRMSKVKNPFGDGHASERIAKYLQRALI